MKNILKKYSDIGLVVLALAFFCTIAGYFSWGIGNLVENLTSVVSVSRSMPQEFYFNIQGVQKLDLRGLAQ
jgi:hypothetical protein